MTDRRRGAARSRADGWQAAAAPAGRFADAPLAALGLEPGDRVRFRRRPDERWTEAEVVGVERDGSLGLRDAKGARRAIPTDLVEVRDEGPRGGRRWEPLTRRVARDQQLPLL